MRQYQPSLPVKFLASAFGRYGVYVCRDLAPYCGSVG